jgi:phosphatidylinositol-3-phosphatase
VRRLLATLLVALAFLPGAAAAGRPVPAFEHVLVIVFENKGPHAVFGNREAPTFNSLAGRYALLPRYSSITHPSLPNYLALVSGSTHGVRSDCTSCIVSGPSLADTLERAGKTWKTYAEGLPRPGFTGCCSGRYAKRHVPFLYFRRVVTRPARLRRVVPLSRLSSDVAARRLPDFSLVVPDLCHDMHDCPVSAGDAWLGRFLRSHLRSSQFAHAVVFVVFDEPPAGEGMLVPALAVGPVVRPGSVFARPTSHYGLLRTIEDALGLARLGASARAAPITGIWR